MNLCKHGWSKWQLGSQPLTDDTVLTERRYCTVKGCTASVIRKVSLAPTSEVK